MSKVKKFFLKPNCFWRDYFLKKVPITFAEGDMFPPKKKEIAKGGSSKKSVTKKNNQKIREVEHNLFQINYPIDVVYTWVDGDDPDFIELKNSYLPNTEKRDKVEAFDSARFQSRDELRYSLRSLAQYAPWVNHVYIVTNGQIPSWLNLDVPNISVVSHEEIIPEQFLPTFNSHVIETCLHRIPNLSEHYLYLNDDVFFSRKVEPNYFFSDAGLAYLFATKAQLPNGPRCKYDTPTQWAAKNARSLIYNNFGVICDFMYAHTFHPQLKSVAEENEKRFSAAVNICRRNKFRGENDLLFASFLNHNIAYITKRALVTSTSCFYFNIRLPDANRYYSTLLSRKGKEEAPFSICLNDHVAAASAKFPNYEQKMQNFLNEYYPVASPYEVVSKEPPIF